MKKGNKDMAKVTQGTERKSAVCTKRFAYAPLTVDNGTTLTYGDVTEIEDILITTKYTPKMNNASQYASGVEVDSYVAKAGGTLEVTIVNTNTADEVALFGSKINTTTGVLENGKDDVVPDVMCIYSTMNSDGKINLYKFPKCKFTSQGETVQTTDENGVTFNSLALQANYKALINTGVDMYCVKGLDPVTDKATIDAWFETASGVIVSTE